MVELGVLIMAVFLLILSYVAAIVVVIVYLRVHLADIAATDWFYKLVVLLYLLPLIGFIMFPGVGLVMFYRGLEQNDFKLRRRL